MPPSSHNRREFIHVTGAALAAIAGGPELAASAEAAAASTQATGGQDPDLIVINAKVYTMDTQAPRAEAFAVTAGRFTAVGATGDIRGLAGQRTEVFDAKGMTVVPGFIDCHNHARGEVLLNEVLVGNPFRWNSSASAASSANSGSGPSRCRPAPGWRGFSSTTRS